MSKDALLRPPAALVVAGAVAFASYRAPGVFPISGSGFIPPSFVTHTVMLVISVALIVLLSRRRVEAYGLTIGTYRFTPRILLWGLPTAALSTLAALAPHQADHTTDVFGLSKLQVVLFIWIYASVAEEVLARGLLQGLLSPLREFGITLRRGMHLSIPVILSGFFFGGMHIVLSEAMGPAVVGVMIFAAFLGLVAACYRERTGSLVPAIIIHSLFNIGGALPTWVADWLRG